MTDSLFVVLRKDGILDRVVEETNDIVLLALVLKKDTSLG